MRTCSRLYPVARVDSFIGTLRQCQLALLPGTNTTAGPQGRRLSAATAPSLRQHVRSSSDVAITCHRPAATVAGATQPAAEGRGLLPPPFAFLSFRAKRSSSTAGPKVMLMHVLADSSGFHPVLQANESSVTLTPLSQAESVLLRQT